MHVFLRSTKFDKIRVSQGPTTLKITKDNSLEKISLAYTNMVFSDMVSNPDIFSIWSTKKLNLEN